MVFLAALPGQVRAGTTGDKVLAISHLGCRERPPRSPSVQSAANHAPVAQLDRVSGYEPEGREFESLRARQ